jgi:hypothetical protein
MQAHPLARDIERRGSYVTHLVKWFRALPLRDCQSDTASVNPAA